jgi:hypothetical protein
MKPEGSVRGENSNAFHHVTATLGHKAKQSKTLPIILKKSFGSIGSATRIVASGQHLLPNVAFWNHGSPVVLEKPRPGFISPRSLGYTRNENALKNPSQINAVCHWLRQCNVV